MAHYLRVPHYTMEGTGLEGQLSGEFFNIPQLQTVMLRNNRIDGTLEIGSSYSRKLQLIDLQNNSINAVVPLPHAYNFTLELAENSVCETVEIAYAYCNDQGHPPLYIPMASCSRSSCTSEQVSGPTCKCAYPLTGNLILRAPNSLWNPTYFIDLQQDLLRKLQNFSLPVDSVAFRSVSMDIFGNLNIQMEIYPAGQVFFNTTGMSLLVFVFNSQMYKPPDLYEPYVFYADPYKHLEGYKTSLKNIIIGAIIGASILLFLCVGGYAYCKWKRARKGKQQANPFVFLDSHGSAGDIPHFKGAWIFTLDELRKCTNNFSEVNNIGSGGYGKVDFDIA